DHQLVDEVAAAVGVLQALSALS
ncbi:MAG: hypothetical protein RI900_2069, partial [Actinomycetota bacterium]